MLVCYKIYIFIYVFRFSFSFSGYKDLVSWNDNNARRVQFVYSIGVWLILPTNFQYYVLFFFVLIISLFKILVESLWSVLISVLKMKSVPRTNKPKELTKYF